MRGLVVGFSILLMSLGFGMAGFRYFENLDWQDSFLNASMLLTGMGPVDEPATNGGRVFAGIYALYSGIIFLSIVAIMVVPIFQRSLNHYAADIHEECDPH